MIDITSGQAKSNDTYEMHDLQDAPQGHPPFLFVAWDPEFFVTEREHAKKIILIYHAHYISIILSGNFKYWDYET